MIEILYLFYLRSWVFSASRPGFQGSTGMVSKKNSTAYDETASKIFRWSTIYGIYIYIWSFRTWRQVLLLLDGLGYQVFFVRISPWFSDLQKKCPDCWSSYLRPNFVLICRPILGSVALLFELRKNTLELFQLHQYLTWPILTLLVIFVMTRTERLRRLGGYLSCFSAILVWSSIIVIAHASAWIIIPSLRDWDKCQTRIFSFTSWSIVVRIGN